jgi:hypothetical protein
VRVSGHHEKEAVQHSHAYRDGGKTEDCPLSLLAWFPSLGEKGNWMGLEHLPDLSDWQKVEIWTVDEAALLWSAIDPDSLRDTHLNFGQALKNQLFDTIDPQQEKKAKIYRRAIVEAICGGTLPFVRAIELHHDYQNGDWDKEVEFPDLPDPEKIVTSRTRVQQAAFIKWAKSKNIPSFRQQVYEAQLRAAKKQSLSAATTSSAVIEGSITEVPGVVLSLPGPSYLDTSHPRYAAKLHAAIRAWESAPEPPPGRTPKQGLVQYLTDNANELGLLNPDGSINRTAIVEAATVANWSIKGGSPKTPE